MGNHQRLIVVISLNTENWTWAGNWVKLIGQPSELVVTFCNACEKSLCLTS